MGNDICQFCSCTQNQQSLAEIKGLIINDPQAGKLINLQSDKQQFYNKVIKDHLKDKINIYYIDQNKNKGFMYLPSKFIYQGQIKEEKMNGKGRLKLIDRFDSFAYEGFFENNILNGIGQINITEQASQIKHIFEGQWRDNYPSKVTMIDLTSRQNTEIQFKDKSFTNGKINFFDGKIYKGQFKYDSLISAYLAHGMGKFIYSNGSYLIGCFVDGYLEGNGLYDGSSGEKYEGQFKMGLFHGDGTFTAGNKSQLKINWVKNKPHGSGLLIVGSKSNNQVVNYQNGKLVRRRNSDMQKLNP